MPFVPKIASQSYYVYGVEKYEPIEIPIPGFVGLKSGLKANPWPEFPSTAEFDCGGSAIWRRGRVQNTRENPAPEIPAEPKPRSTSGPGLVPKLKLFEKINKSKSIEWKYK